MDPLLITRRIRYAGRLREILNILIKHGFGFIVDELGLKPFAKITHRVIEITRRPRDIKISMPRRIRFLFEELGPTFIKFGQILSLRLDIVSEEYSQEFSKLLDETSPLPFSRIAHILDEELGADWRKHFKTFSEKAYKSASLAQVHKAVLKNGDLVAVKVQRPDIRRIVEKDLSILSDIAGLVESRIEEFRKYQPIQLVNELKININRELDFYREATHTKQLRFQNIENENIVIPKVYWEYTTSRVLITEFIKGTPLSEIFAEGIEKYTFNRKNLATTLIKSFFNQMFIDGVFHADPHPGNIIITDNNKIGLIDCGLLGVIDEETKDRLAFIAFGIMRNDYQLVANEYLKLGFDEDIVNIKRFKRDISSIIERWTKLPLKHIDLPTIFNEINAITRTHNLKLPSDLLLLIKTINTIEALSRKIYPDLEIIDITEEPIKKLLKSRINKDILLNKTIRLLTDVLFIVENLPTNISRLINKLLMGRIRLKFKHEGLENLTNTLSVISTRLSLSFIIGSVIVGSSYILSVDIGPKFFQIPVMSIIGYLISLLLSVWLLINIVRK
jgi:ubiquinone biosynthesis protein